MNDMRQMTALGRSIEDGSFAIIDAEAGAHGFDAREWQVVRRVIHATADFEFKSLMRLSARRRRGGHRRAARRLPGRRRRQDDLAGLNEERLAAYGCTSCTASSRDDDVIADAKANGLDARHRGDAQGARRWAPRRRGRRRRQRADGAARGGAAGREEGARPALVVGVPVGFVSAAESKEAAMAAATPYIVARGRKGGRPIAVAIIHALLLLSATEAAS